jgi:hypothetical protein
MRWHSADRHFQVTVITFDGTQKFRVEYDQPTVMHTDMVTHRFGPVQTRKGWWLVADVTSTEALGELVPLSELVEGD